MIKIKKPLCALLAALMMTTAFSGCAESGSKTESGSDPSSESSSAQEEKVDLSGKIVFATPRTDFADTTIRELADKFIAEHPEADIEIEIEAVQDPQQSLSPRLSAGEAPDIHQNLDIKQEDLPRYFLPLDAKLFNEDTIVAPLYGTDGQTYLIPTSASYTGLLYNKKVFRDLGLEPPKTLEDFYAVCEKIKDAGIVPMASNFKDGWPMQMFGPFYEAEKSGNAGWQQDMVDNGVFFPEDSARMEGLNILRELKDRDFLEPDLTSTNWDQFQSDFAQGKVAMCYLGTWIGVSFVNAGIKAEDIGVIPFPGTEYLDVSGDTWLGVSATSKYPELAKAFFEYLYEDSNYANAIGAVTPLIGAEVVDPFAADLVGSGLPLVVVDAPPPEWVAIVGEMQFAWGNMFQEYLLAEGEDGKKAVIEKYNKQFSDAKAAVADS